MGVPIERLVIGSNSNDILTRFLETGSMTARDVTPTLSPSMDIQVSSNFERLLFEVNGRDGGMTAEQLQRFRAVGRLTVEADQRAEYLAPVFGGARFDDAATLAVIGDVYAQSGMLLDPHTAVGLAAGREHHRPGTPTVASGDRSPGEVPRCGRTGDRHPATAPDPPRRPVRPTRADPRAARRPGDDRTLRRVRRPQLTERPSMPCVLPVGCRRQSLPARCNGAKATRPSVGNGPNISPPPTT